MSKSFESGWYNGKQDQEEYWIYEDEQFTNSVGLLATSVVHVKSGKKWEKILTVQCW